MEIIFESSRSLLLTTGFLYVPHGPLGPMYPTKCLQHQKIHYFCKAKFERREMFFSKYCIM